MPWSKLEKRLVETPQIIKFGRTTFTMPFGFHLNEKIFTQISCFYSRSCFATINLLNTSFHSFIKSVDVLPDRTHLWPFSRSILTISAAQFWLFASYSLALFKTFFSTLQWPIEITSMHFRNQRFPIDGDCMIFYEIRMTHRWSSIKMHHGNFLGEKFTKHTSYNFCIVNGWQDIVAIHDVILNPNVTHFSHRRYWTSSHPAVVCS